MRAAIALAILFAGLPRADAAFVHAVTCGSPIDLPSEGVLFLADQEYDGQNGWGAIGGLPHEPTSEQLEFALIDRDTIDTYIYAQQRIGPDSYLFEVDNGSYELSIHLAGFQRDGEGTGVMTIVAEAETLFADFDLNADVGKARLCELRAPVDVADGLLEIDFHDSRGDHDISAIALRTPGNPGPPAAPSGLDAVDSFGGVLLRWDRNTVPDLAGYAVLQLTSTGWQEVAERIIPMAVVPTDTTTRYGIVAFDLHGELSDTTFSADVGPRSPTLSPLPEYEILVSPAALRLLDEDVFADTEVFGTLIVDAIPRNNVGLSYRGKSSRDAPKKSWNIDLGNAAPVHGTDRLVLKATFPDPTIQRELLMADLLEQAALPHSITFPFRLVTNGEYSGVYIDIERLDENFLARIGRSAGTFYRSYNTLEPLGDLDSYVASFEVASGADHWDRRELIDLAETLDRLPDEDLRPWLERNIDIDGIVELYCRYIWGGSEDWLGDDHFLHHDAGDSLWRMIPWDLHETFEIADVALDLVYATAESPNGIGRYNHLIDRVLHVPSLRRRYFERLRELTAGPLSAASIAAIFSARTTQIGEDTDRDVQKRPREIMSQYQDAIAEVHQFITEREIEVLAQLDELEPPEHVLVQISELEPAPDGQNVVGIELLNLADRPVDLTDFYLSDERAQTLKWPVDSTRITAAERTTIALSTPVPVGGWIGLSRDLGGSAMVDSVQLPPALHPARGFGRYPDTGGRWRLLDDRSMGAPNTWTNPIALALEMSPRHFALGDPVFLRVETTNAPASYRMNGELQLFVTTLEGISLFGGSVFETPLSLPSGSTRVRQGSLTIPGSFEPGGYRAEMRFVIDSDDILASAEAELFITGDGPGTLVVNELMASNDTTIADEWGEFDDWVELYNDTDTSIPLDSLYLSDDLKDEPFKWALPALDIAPRDHLIIWCDGEPAQGTRHADFKLGSDGEEIAITMRGPGDEPILIDWIVFGPQTSDVSYGRYPDGLESLVTLDAASPDGVNLYVPR